MSAGESSQTTSATSELAVGRLAPSPTGELHLGHARSFLLAYWSIRSRAGRLLLRLEDLDFERCRDAFIDAVRRDLEWLGIDWDDEWLQSRRKEAIVAAAHDLLAKGRAYPCICSRGDIRDALSAPHGRTATGYSGHCRQQPESTLEAAERTHGKPAGLRFRTEDGDIRFTDAVAGPQTFQLRAGSDDFLILRRDKTPAYHLAVVVDDAAYGVNEVLRGDDLLDSTPLQLVLYEALNEPPPRYAHVSLVVDEQGRRLAKRHESLSLRRLRDSGIDPRSIVIWAATSAGISLTERVAAASVTPHFDLRRLNRTPVRALPPVETRV